MLFLLPFELHPRADVQGVSIRLSQIFGLALIVLCVPIIIEKRKDWLTKPWILLALFIFVSTISSLLSMGRIKGLMVTLFCGFDFLLAYVVSKTFDLKNSDTYKKIIFISGLVVTIFCIFQFFGDSLGVSNKYTLLLVRYTKEIFGFPRIQGFSLEPLYLANFIFIPLSLALSGYLFTKKKYLLVLSSIFSTVILLTVARGAYVALIALIVFSLSWLIHKKSYHQALSIVIAGLISVAIFIGLIRISGTLASSSIKTTIVPQSSEQNLPDQTVSSGGNTTRLVYHINSFGADQSFADRKRTAQVALEVGLENTLLGVGPGNYGKYLVKKIPDKYSDTNQIVNNEPAEIFAETGFLGFITISLFVIYCLRKMIYYDTTKNTALNNMWFFATSFMLLAFAIQWQTFSTLYITHIWVIVGIFLALLYNSNKYVMKHDKNQ